MGIHLPTCSDSSCKGCNIAMMQQPIAMPQVAVAMPQAATSTGTVSLAAADMRKLTHIFLATVFWFIYVPLLIGPYTNYVQYYGAGQLFAVVTHMVFLVAGGA